MAHQGGGDALPGERRQHPDVGHGRVTHQRPAGQRQPAGHRVGGADELPAGVGPDRAARLEQRADLAGCQPRQRREPDHGGAEHVGGGNQVVFVVENTDLDSHAAIMSRAAGGAARGRSLPGHRMGRPVSAREMTSRWISLVPSKMVKILASRCIRSTG